jgi:hypothetical protein
MIEKWGDTPFDAAQFKKACARYREGFDDLPFP